MVCRAVIAVAALYALALQAVLAGALVTIQPELAHVICAPDAGSSPDGSDKAPPVHSHLTCCTAAHSPQALTPPVLACVTLAWPRRDGVRVSWRPDIVARPRAPPGVVASARAPPVA
nr:hypothetical protein [Methylobacterium oryzihabitans]